MRNVTIWFKGCLIIYIVILVFLLLFLMIPFFRTTVFNAVLTILGAQNTNVNMEYYTASDVQEICIALQLDKEDEFCNSMSRQNHETLSAALSRNFGPGTTTYSSISLLISVLPSSHTCETINDYLRQQINNCPPPGQCTQDYNCYLFFSETVGYLQLRIDHTTGRILSFLPSRPRESN